jgi:hypothetical protein
MANPNHIDVLREVKVHANYDVLMKVDDNSLLIVGNPP